MPEAQIKEISADITRLHSNTQSLMLATQDEEGVSDISSAPYVFIDGCYYIFISELAAHTAHLKNAPQAAILLIEDEAVSRNIFARLRLSWVVMARMLATSEKQYLEVMHALEARFGSTVGLLKSLPDFRLCELRPQQGRLISGFGKAYSINAQDLWSLFMKSENTQDLTQESVE